MRLAVAGLSYLRCSFISCEWTPRPGQAFDRDKVTVERVRKDIFQDYVSVIGAVEPIQIVHLDATEAAGSRRSLFVRARPSNVTTRFCGSPTTGCCSRSRATRRKSPGRSTT